MHRGHRQMNYFKSKSRDQLTRETQSEDNCLTLFFQGLFGKKSYNNVAATEVSTYNFIEPTSRFYS